MWINRGYEQPDRTKADREPPWASWQYDRDEWKQFISKDRARFSSVKRSRFLLILLAVSAISVLVGAMGWLAGGFYGAICLTIVPFVWIIGIQSMWWSWLNQSKIQWYDRLDAASHKVVITPTQVRIGDSSVPLVGPDVALTGVWIDQAEPTILRFQAENTSGRKVVNEIWLPVPKGREAEAEQIAERFRTEVVPHASTETP